MNPKITRVDVRDIRFPTSLKMDGSDALNLGDYSATYVTVVTDSGLTGDGLTFTNGRGNEIVVAAVHALKHHVIGRRLSEVTNDLRGLYRWTNEAGLSGRRGPCPLCGSDRRRRGG